MAHQRKAALNEFWMECVRGKLQVEVGTSAIECIDTAIWDYVEHEYVQKKKLIGAPYGYEPQWRLIKWWILYWGKKTNGRMGFCFTVIPVDLVDFKHEVR